MIGRPLRLVVLLQDLEFGGTQRYALSLLDRIDRGHFAPQLWLLRGGTQMLSPARASGVEVQWLSHSRRVSPIAILRLVHKLHCERPDVLYTLTVVPNIWGRLMGRLSRVPVVVSGYRGLLPKQHERWLWHLSDGIICNSAVLQGVMVRRIGVDPRRIAIIPNGVDTDFFSPGPDQRAPEPMVVSVARLVPEKDPLNLVKAFARVRRRIPLASLVLIGTGPLAGKVRSRIQSLGLESRVTMIPGSEDVRPLLRRAWVFALGSASEGAPNAILEAMAMALPVVATRVGGVPDLVVDGATGILLPPNDPEAMAGALIDLLGEESKRSAMGLKGRERVVACHNLDRMVRQTERVLAAGGGSRGALV